jgi:NAD(P)-dependent dehydrogenase (short-subunit alcohol dehydrogenase family)
MNKSQQKIAIVTSGAQGICKSITCHFLGLDIAVFVADIDAEAGEECVQEYRSAGKIRFIRTDVSDLCSVYLDGEEKASLSLPNVDACQKHRYMKSAPVPTG